MVEVNVVSVQKDVWIRGWRKPVMIILCDNGHVFMTEYYKDKDVKLGKNTFKLGVINSKQYQTVIL